MMGSNSGDKDEKPIHYVTVSDFLMTKTEVTQSLWKAVMGNNPSDFVGDNLPVEQVTWNEVQEFIKKLNRIVGKKYRLPTEAEWEFAAGGGASNRTKWSGTDIESSVTLYGWYDLNSKSTTQEVASKMANSLGLHDMTGNVREWCGDWYSDYLANDQDNPTGAISGSSRVIRGGGWLYDVQNCRITNRLSFPPNMKSNSIGFRLVLVP